MSSYLDFSSLAPETVRPLLDSNKLLAQSGIEPALLTLVQLRVSQINGCSFCLALHALEAQALGESRDRLAVLPAWRESPWYTARERAALEWAEALTKIAFAHPPADLLARVKEQFTEREVVYLSLAINVINAFNRLCVGFNAPPEGAQAVFESLHPAPVRQAS